MKDLLKVFKALSDPNRLKILKLLEEKGMCVCELQEALKISQPGVSKHLKILEDAELVVSRKDGLWVNYFLNNNPGNSYTKELLTDLKGWINEDPEIAQLKKLAPSIDRVKIKVKSTCECTESENKEGAWCPDVRD